MSEWAAWGRAVGTLLLAGATFAAARSSNRSARIAVLLPERPARWRPEVARHGSVPAP